MTRIIAGVVGGRSLRTPPGSGTRPTSDRVREALFSALSARDVLIGARVLDLFAGSGALGLEAASRGAASVELVESERKAAQVIRVNISALGLSGVRVTPTTVITALATPQPRSIDLVFIDPPYDLTEAALAQVLEHLVAGERLSDEALVIVERSSRSPEPTWPVALEAERSKKYGETTLWFARPHRG